MISVLYRNFSSKDSERIESKRILLKLVGLKLVLFVLIKITLAAVVMQPDLIRLITAAVHLLVRVMFTL